jgi:hypothetical protein
MDMLRHFHMVTIDGGYWAAIKPSDKDKISSWS